MSSQVDDISRLELEGLWLLPWEALVGKVSVLGGLVVDRLREVELLHDHTRTEVKVVPDDLNQLVGGLRRSAVRVDEDGERLSNTDGVGKLDKATTSQLGVDEGLGDPAGDIGGRTVDLGVVLAGEGTTAVGAPASVGVDDDLTTSKTGVTLRTTDDEQARWLQVVDGAVIEELGRDDLVDDLFLELLSHGLSGDICAVLRGDDNGVDTQRLHSTVVVSVLDGDLGLGVRAEPREGSVNAGLLHGPVQLVGEQDGQRQHLRGLISGIAKHNTLVTGTELLQSLIVVKALSDVRRLLLNSDKDVAGLVVKALVGVVVANVLDNITDDLLVVQVGLGGDFTEDHDHT